MTDSADPAYRCKRLYEQWVSAIEKGDFRRAIGIKRKMLAVEHELYRVGKSVLE